MVISEWSSCPHCKMCANFSDFKRVLENEPVCPMCEEAVQPTQVRIADNPQEEFKTLAALMKDQSDKKDEDAEGNDLDSDEELLK